MAGVAPWVFVSATVEDAPLVQMLGARMAARGLATLVGAGLDAARTDAEIERVIGERIVADFQRFRASTARTAAPAPQAGAAPAVQPARQIARQ
jgi:hypothetical protein